MRNGIFATLSTVVITVFIGFVFVLTNPEATAEGMGLVTMFALPIASFFISIVAYTLMHKVFPSGWLLMIPATTLSMFISFFTYVTFAPNSSFHWSTVLSTHQIPDGIYRIGDVPFSLADEIGKEIPDMWLIYAIDAGGDKDWYTFLATDNLDNYLIGFSEKKEPAKIRYITVDQIWREVQKQEKLASSATYTQVVDLPLADGNHVLFDKFARTKVLHFQSKNHLKFKVKVFVENNNVVVSVAGKNNH